jgi:hypothetical protein
MDWKKKEEVRKKVDGSGKELPEVLRMVQKLWNRLWIQGNTRAGAE